MLSPIDGKELRDAPQRWKDLNDFQRALIGKSHDLVDSDEPVWHCMSEYLTPENLAIVSDGLK
jgi:hypothetical protein